MPDYIDREKLIKYIHDNGRNFCITEANRWNFSEIARMVKSEDVSPVVHARWIWNPNGMDYGLGAWQCSHCFTRNNNLPMNRKMNPLMFIGSKYCPNCGAKMDAEQEEPTNGKHDAE